MERHPDRRRRRAVTVPESAAIATVLHELARTGEVVVERCDGADGVRVVGAPRRATYVGLFGNHPFELARRPVVLPRELGPSDFVD